MSVDQTSQLIQLMLNSVLMMALCGAVAIGLILRQSAIAAQLRLLKPVYGDVLNGMRFLPPERFLQLKSQMRLLRRQYRLVFWASWSASGALIFCAGSTLLLALRSLMLLNLLIPMSLLLFAGGAALLLLGLVLGLLSWIGADGLKDDRSPDATESIPGRSRSPIGAHSPLPAREAAQTLDRTSLRESLSALLPSRSPGSLAALRPVNRHNIS